ncbi:MAG: hypothetical protein DRG11_00705 [Epsilonproteobacteria bacterium]|nr:MAG: hypothetical protein DRG11_00705 [Campylobacterota bacterium]
MNSIAITIKEANSFNIVKFEQNETMNIKKESLSCQTIDDCPVSTHNIILDKFENVTINKQDEIGFDKIWIDDTNSLSVQKNEHRQIRKNYSKLRKPILYSPYHILLFVAKTKQNKDGLFCLIYDGLLYCIAINKYNKIIFYDSLSLVSDDIAEPPIDEKITKKLEAMIENFYTQNNSSFVEYIQIYKNSNVDNITNSISVQNNLKIDTKILPIDIHQTIYNIVSKSMTNINYDTKPNYKVLKTTILIVVLMGGLYYAYQNGYFKKIQIDSLKNITLGSFKTINTDKIKNYIPDINTDKIRNYISNINTFEDISQTIFDTKVSQEQYNNIIKNRTKRHFDMISKDIYLDKFYLSKNNAKLYATLLYKESFSFVLKDKLKMYYKKVYSTKIKKYKNNFKTSIICKEKKAENYYVDRIKNKQKTTSKMKSIVSDIFPLGTKIKIKTQKKKKKLFLKTYIKNVVEFYSLIDKLNEKKLNIQYPIIFKKQQNNIEVKFYVE